MDRYRTLTDRQIALATAILSPLEGSPGSRVQDAAYSMIDVAAAVLDQLMPADATPEEYAADFARLVALQIGSVRSARAAYRSVVH